MTTTNRLVLTLFVPAIFAAAGCASSAPVAPEAPTNPSSDSLGIAAAVSAAVPAVAPSTLAEERDETPAADGETAVLDVPTASVASSGADRYRPIAEGYISSTAFQRRFTNGLLAVTDIEPPVDPEDVKDLQKVIELIGAGEEEKALQLIARKTTKVSSALLPFLEGQVHYQADPVRHEQAIAAFERALDEFEGYPRFQRAWFNLALCHYDLEQWDKAARALKQSVTLGRVDSLTYGLLGAACCAPEISRARRPPSARR